MIIQLLANGIVEGALLAVLALGFSIQYNGSRFFAFTYGATFVVAAYATLALSAVLPLLLAAMIALAIAVVTSLAFEVIIYRPIRSTNGSSLALMIASIGLYTIVQNLISLGFGDDTRYLREPVPAEAYSFHFIRLSSIQLLCLAVSLVCLFATTSWLAYSRLGRRLRAVSDDFALSRIVGVDVKKSLSVSTAVGAALSGVCGVVIGLDLALVPTMGFDALLLAIVACIVGGTSSYRGAIAGGFLIGIVRSVGVWGISSEWRDFLVFLVLIVTLIVRPYGIFGVRSVRAHE